MYYDHQLLMASWIRNKSSGWFRLGPVLWNFKPISFLKTSNRKGNMGGENKYSTSGPGIKKQCFCCQWVPNGKFYPFKGFLNPQGTLIFPNQHIAVFNVEVQEEEERDEEAEEGDGGAFPKTPHLVQGFPHQPHAVHALTGICRGRKNKRRNEKSSFLGMLATLNNRASTDCRGIHV